MHTHSTINDDDHHCKIDTLWQWKFPNLPLIDHFLIIHSLSLETFKFLQMTMITSIEYNLRCDGDDVEEGGKGRLKNN